MTTPTGPSAPTSPPDQALIEAAEDYGRRVCGQAVKRITLTLEDGSKRKVEPPADAWPPAEGWAARGNLGACDGVAFALAGKSLAVFRLLVEAGPEGLSAEDVRAKVWDRHTDCRTVQNAVSKLRHAIRAALGLGDEVEPLDASGDRYRLAAVSITGGG